MAYARVPLDEEVVDAEPEASGSGLTGSALPLPSVPDTYNSYSHYANYNPDEAGSDAPYLPYPTSPSTSQGPDTYEPYYAAADLPFPAPSPSPSPAIPRRPTLPPPQPAPYYNYRAPAGEYPSAPVVQPRPYESGPYSQYRPSSQQPYQQPHVTLPQSGAASAPAPYPSYYPGTGTGQLPGPAPGRYYSEPAAPPPQAYPQPPYPYSAPAPQLPQAIPPPSFSAPVQVYQPYPPQSYSAPQPLPQQSYSTPQYSQQIQAPVSDAHGSGQEFLPNPPPSQLPARPPPNNAQPGVPTNTTAGVVDDPSTAQYGSGSREDASLRIWVQDGSASNSFIEAKAIAEYLRLFPEADNDQGCRVFRYGPMCATALLMPLFESLDFSRFSQFPYGLSGNFSVKDQWGSGSCTCKRCYAGQLCGHYVLSKNFEFYLPLETTKSTSTSPRIESVSGVTSMSIGTSRYDFYHAHWNMQLFRFRSRRSETTMFAYDALIFQNYDLEVRARGTPLDYIFNQLDLLLTGWDSVLAASSQFLDSFRVEVLEERLSTDRSVVRSLVVAAQHWEAFRKMLSTQLQRLEFLENVHGDPRWTEGRENQFETAAMASGYLQRFRAVDFRIRTELMQETDGLIQRVTNLVSIDEGYRSRDQNESIRRLTWITFIFLPLLFTSALFSMQLDIFSNPAPWQYYIYTSLVLIAMIGFGYVVLRSRRRVIFVGKAIIAYPILKLLGLLTLYLEGKQQSNKADVEKQVSDAEEEAATIVKWAASSGNVDVLRNILHTTVSEGKPLKPGASGQALILAIQNGHKDAADLFMEAKEGLQYQDLKGATPLHWAAKGGHSSICQALLQNGVEKNTRTWTGDTALDWAMEGGDGLTINLLLKGDKKFTRSDTLNLQSLHFSARIGDLKMVRDLHKKGSSLEMRDSQGQTVLFYAVRGGQHAVVKWLLVEGKANVQAVEREGLTALHVAAQLVDDKIVSLLIKYGANVNALSNMHLTPLHMLPDGSDHSLRVLATLCEHGANINAQSKDDNRFTHRAASVAISGAKLLQAASSHGADLNARGAAGNSPAHCAAACGCQESLEFLREKSVDIIHCRNAAGYTPLMTAAQAGHTAAMMYLLDQGATYSVADGDGRSLVELSIGWGNPEVVSILRARGAEYGHMSDGDHPVWDAVRDGQPGAVLEQLLAGGLSVEYSRGGVRLLQLALESANAEATSILLERGALVDTTDSYGWTALHSAAFGGDVASLLLVLQRAGNRAPKDNQGWTPLHIAAFYKHEEAEKVLDPEGKMERFGPMDDLVMISGTQAWAAARMVMGSSILQNLAEAPGN